MRTACLIRDEPPLRWFVNRLHALHGVDLAVVEVPPGPPRSPAARLRQIGARRLPRAVRDKALARRRAAAEEAALDRVLGDGWRALDPSVPVLRAPSVNDPAVVARLRELRPGVLLDHGTSIVRDEALTTAPVALNLHWGLSPYYRGTRCTAWALINWDPRNIGVTIHQLSAEIDGGGVIGQARPEITPADTVHSINMKLTVLGTEIVADVMGHLAGGGTLAPVVQDFSQGFLTYNRQWDPRLDRHVERIERDGTVGRMLEQPAREARLPIVTFG